MASGNSRFVNSHAGIPDTQPSGRRSVECSFYPFFVNLYWIAVGTAECSTLELVASRRAGFSKASRCGLWAMPHWKGCSKPDSVLLFPCFSEALSSGNEELRSEAHSRSLLPAMGTRHHLHPGLRRTPKHYLEQLLARPRSYAKLGSSSSCSRVAQGILCGFRLAHDPVEVQETQSLRTSSYIFAQLCFLPSNATSCEYMEKHKLDCWIPINIKDILLSLI